MCKLKILELNEYGYVAKCEKCNHIQIAFGNIVMTQEEKEFHEFKKFISHRYKSRQTENEIVCPQHKSIYLQIPNSNIKFLFNKNELEKLNELLEQSSILLEVEKIFAVNEN